jgi:apolipoprotein D and lipocalin family protein
MRAQYKLQSDGSIQVINRGFNASKKKWREAQGVAKFTGASDVGSLKVSFFGPFYGGYHVVALDSVAYQWSMVIGPDTDFLWILCRDRQLPSGVQAQLLTQARQLGVNTDALIWVDQSL